MDTFKCKMCPVPFNSYVHPSAEELGKHMKQAHNMVSLSVSRDDAKVDSDSESKVSMAIQWNDQDTSQANVEGSIQDVHGGEEIDQGHILLLGEHSSGTLDIESRTAAGTLPIEMRVANLKKYKCAKSGCGHLTNSIIEMVTHKNACIGSPGFGSVQHDNGLSIKKIKVMRRDGSLPGLKCEHCPNINYSFVSLSDLRRHVEDIHGGQKSEQDQAVDLQEPQQLKNVTQREDMPGGGPPLQGLHKGRPH